MNTYAGKISVARRSFYSLHLPDVSAYIHWLLNGMLILIKATLEYALGIHVGAAIGYTSGLHIGHLYVELFKPVYLSELVEIKQWLALPYIFAIYGVIVGVIAGSIVIAITNRKLLRQRVAALYEHGVTDPEEIAQTLIKPKWEVQRAISNLVEQYEQ
jgi:hypothetical protein